MTAMFEQKPTNFFYSNLSGNCANQHASSNMASNRKRHLEDQSMDELDAPLEKKKYEQISDDLNKFSINSPIIQEVDDEFIDEDLPTTSEVLPDEAGYIVEEPEEAGQLVLSNDLINYLKRKQTDSIRSRIIELTGHQGAEEVDESEQPTVDESKSPSPTANSPVCLDEEEMMDDEDRMEID